jgi:hypothetical protein
MELRVHGVGGTSAESMLRCDDPETPDENETPLVTWRSDSSAKSRVLRRRDRGGVFAYHWAPLTSGSKWFALWPLLLPFTLSNVAGFMTTQAGGARARVFRTAAVLQAFALTAAVTWWAWAAMYLVLDPTTLDHAPLLGADDRGWVGLALGVLAVAALVVVSTASAGGFERYRRRGWTAPSGAAPWGARAFGDLSDPGFYDNERAHTVRWALHLSAAVIAMLAAVWWASAGTGGVANPTRELGWLLLGATAAVALCALAMALVPGAQTNDRLAWRFLAPSTTVSAVALLGGLVLSACLWRVSVAELPRGPLVLVYSAYGWAAGAFAVGLACCLLWRLRTPSDGEPIERPQRPLPTFTGRVASRLALTPGHAQFLFGTFAVTFLVATATSVVANHGDLDDYRLTSTPPVGLARWTFALLIGFLFLNLIKSRADPAVLRRVGMIWDVLTFWPRTYHPFAVRCYAERAVPELQELLDQPERSSVVVLAHSQGSVLAYAALRPLLVDPATAHRADDWGLVTVGCPLRSLYHRAFPRYFTGHEFADVRDRLDGRWGNLFRYTDYIGRAVFASDGLAVAGDPPSDAPDCWVPTPRSNTTPLEFHGNYWEDPWVVARVRDTARRIHEGIVR